MVICGVYKITNKYNGRFYIGSSENIFNRWKTHLDVNMQGSLTRELSYKNVDTFIFEVLEISPSRELAREKEVSLLAKERGNPLLINERITKAGGTVGERLLIQGEKHHNAKLTEADVLSIRERRFAGENRSDVYQDYSDIIQQTGFNKVWGYSTWKHLAPELKEISHIPYYGSQGGKNSRAKFTESQVLQILKRKQLGEPMSEVYLDYKEVAKHPSTFRNIWNRKSWKHINL